jgi:uncharacterized protein YjdB
MTRRWILLTVLGLFVGVISGCDACDKNKNPTGPTSLTVTPATITMQVGQTMTINATVRVNGEIDTATFESSNQGVAIVDFVTGLVRCVSAGQATITVRAGVTATTTLVPVTCTPAVLIDVTPTTVPFTHSVGVTVCPQKIGTIKVTNTSSASITVTLTPSNPAITLDATSATIQPGASSDVGVNFNCSTQASFSATVSIVASNGTVTDTRNVTITATISR